MRTHRAGVSLGELRAELAPLAANLIRSTFRFSWRFLRRVSNPIAVPSLIAVCAISTSFAQSPPKPPQAQSQDGSEFIFSPWTKFCDKFQGTKDVCITGRDSRLPNGQSVTAVAFVEPAGEPKKALRVTVPSPLQLQYGANISIDANPGTSSPFFLCLPTGCLVEVEAPPDMVAKMKSGQTLHIQAINLAGEQVNYSIPLADFKKANEGPAMDPKALQEQQNKLRDELQKKAEEERKRLGLPQ
jgi:invasion protein IalB